MSDRFRQSDTLRPHGPANPCSIKGSPTGTAAYPLSGSHQKASAAEIASVIELQAIQEGNLITWGIEGDAIRPGQGNSS